VIDPSGPASGRGCSAWADAACQSQTIENTATHVIRIMQPSNVMRMKKSSPPDEPARFTAERRHQPMKSWGAVILAFTAGCVNLSTLQTARALEPGKQQILVGGGFYASPSVNASASSVTGNSESLALPYLELGYRRGITDGLELGAKATVPGT